MRGQTLASVLVMVLACAGCATEAPGQPVPATDDSTPATSTAASRTGEAPPINSPELDLASYQNRVCDLLTPELLTPLGIHGSGEPRDDVGGPSCTWKPPDATADPRINLVILSKVGYGWDGLYARKARWKLFEDVEINGYPAAHLDTGDGTQGRCETAVGVRRDLLLAVLVQMNRPSSPEYKTPCALSDRAANSAIDTLKGGR